MADESYWVERAQSAEVKLTTLQESMDRIKADARSILDTFAARKKANGSFDIDYQKLVERLGMENALELRRVIDEHYRVSGAPGEKPRVKLSA